jgi:3-methyladenine DNA glycosylase AlkD
MKALGSAERAAANLRFFKTGPGQYGQGDRFLGLDLPTLRKLARDYQALPLGTLRGLLKSPWHETRLLALVILVKQYRQGDAPHRRAIHGLYVDNTRYINSWDLVDASAEHIIGPHRASNRRALLTRLAKSDSVWERRIAMLATFCDIKAGRFADALRIAGLLLDDEHDLIHKAVGWMLREIGKRDLRVEQAFLRAHVGRIPRTTLRYAIERFPEKVRRRYLTAAN